MNSKLLSLSSLLVTIISIEAAPPYAGRSPGNKLTASDAADGDSFGISVAISGNRILVGAESEDGAGSNRGAAYVYDLGTGIELSKLTASDPGDNDLFGQAVAISGDLAIVGAYSEDGAGANRGAAYVYDMVTGTERFKLIASNPGNGDEFGNSVAISGSLAVVGAPGEDTAGSNAGAAYVYDLNTGSELAMLTASDAENDDQFGWSVAISGNFALVGAKLKNDGGTQRGAAYVFDLTSGEELFKLAASDAEDSDRFGTSVALAGNRAIVGAPNHEGAPGPSGAAYVFDLGTGREIRKLIASDPAFGDQFGFSVSISGNLGLIGAFSEDGAGSNRGAAYVFDIEAGRELYKQTAVDAENSDGFGFSVALSGTFAVSGAQGEDGAGSNRGAVYVYQIDQYQPDNIAGPKAFSGVGDDRYNTDGAGQTQSLVSSKLRPVRGFFTVTSDGDRGEDFLLAATPGDGFFGAQYYRQSGTNRTNVTAALVAGTHRERNIVPEEPGRVISVEVTPSSKLKKRIRRKGKLRTTYLRKTFLARLTSTSTTHDFKGDAAIVRVMTR